MNSYFQHFNSNLAPLLAHAEVIGSVIFYPDDCSENYLPEVEAGNK